MRVLRGRWPSPALAVIRRHCTAVGRGRPTAEPGQPDWPGSDQANWLLTEACSSQNGRAGRTMVNIPLDRDKPVPLARQIQAHLERLIRERPPGAGREAAGHPRARPTRSASTGPPWRSPTRSWWRPAGPAPTWGRARSSPIGPRAASRRRRRPPRRHALDWSRPASRAAPQIVGADDERCARRSAAIPSTRAVISFAGGMPDSGLFPTDAFRRVLNQVIREEGEVAPAVLPGRRLPAAPALPLDLPAALRPRGAARGDPDRQRLAAGLRSASPAR